MPTTISHNFTSAINQVFFPCRMTRFISKEYYIVLSHTTPGSSPMRLSRLENPAIKPQRLDPNSPSGPNDIRLNTAPPSVQTPTARSGQSQKGWHFPPAVRH